MAIEKTEKLAAIIFKTELTKKNLTYDHLCENLKKNGIEISSPAIRNKLTRGTFSFAFFLDCMKAIGTKNLDLEMYFRDADSES